MVIYVAPQAIILFNVNARKLSANLTTNSVLCQKVYHCLIIFIAILSYAASGLLGLIGIIIGVFYKLA